MIKDCSTCKGCGCGASSSGTPSSEKIRVSRDTVCWNPDYDYLEKENKKLKSKLSRILKIIGKINGL